MSKNLCYTVSDEYDNLRIDKFISEVNSDLSRSFVQKIIDDKAVFLNDKAVKASTKVLLNDTVRLTVPDSVIPDIVAEDIPLDIRYEDDDIVILYKPKNMVVHPANGNYTGTLVNGLMYYLKDRLSGINGTLRPGIVHRIDKDTTGLLVVCKNDNAHRMISEQLKEHSVTRRYTAICCGIPDDEGVVDKPIGRNPSDRKKMAVNYSNGKNAVTHYKVLEKFKGYALIECVLETGRTHQIRVHMASLGHPLLGDELYGGCRPGFTTYGQTLHAGVLGLVRPSDNTYIELNSELPEYFTAIIEKLRKLR